MLAWHVAGALFLFRWIFREPDVDVRFLTLGALLPDLVDLPVGAGFASERYASGELWGHSLLFAAFVMTVIMIVFRRGSRRKAGMALAVGVLFHLLLDGMWTDTQRFLWPFAGFDHPPGPTPFWPEAWSRATSDPIRWVLEAVGVGYLVSVWKQAGLSDPERRRRFLATGVLTTAG